ncbi:hypothetical protein [Lysobacter sp. Hz 25]|uniref:hypothetical protein n=1 Tax=Lysobacter sp. Hz 25 TaxID=3383698 RepID=UPI0038D3CDDE
MDLIAEGGSKPSKACANATGRVATLCAAAIAVAGCGPFDSRLEWESGAYAVLWIDEPSNSKLSYRVHPDTSVSVVDACVSAIADSAQFIGARQQPSAQDAGERYFVVRKQEFASGVYPTPSVAGPLSAAEYDALVSRLKLPALESVGSPGACDPKGATGPR